MRAKEDSDKKTERISFRITIELKDDLECAAEVEQRSISDIITLILKKHFNNKINKKG